MALFLIFVHLGPNKICFKIMFYLNRNTYLLIGREKNVRKNNLNTALISYIQSNIKNVKKLSGENCCKKLTT